MLNVLVFDLGGTLMAYKGMPRSWVEYYKKAFDAVNMDLGLNLSEADILQSCEILKSNNARVVYREVEYTPEAIFDAVTAHWRKKADTQTIISHFFKGLKLEPVIDQDAVACLERLRKKGYKLAALTDLPTAMPDEIFKKDIADLLRYFDLYVSSLVCGFRKPNKSGLVYIAEFFGVSPEDLVFIGDEEKDIQTALNAHCRSVLVIRKNALNGSFGQDMTITSLNQLYAVNRYGIPSLLDTVY